MAAEPWQQLPGETGAAYQAFQAYLTLGPTRTITEAYRAHKGTNGAASGIRQAPGNWKKWAAEHRWIDRAASYDQRGQAVASKAREQVIAADAKAQTREQLRSQRRQQQEEQEWELGDLLIAKAREMLATKLFTTRAVTPDGKSVEVKPAKWSLRTAGEFLELAQKLRRCSSRMPLAIEDERETDGDSEKFFQSSGELADAIAPGKVPDMPADTHVKPATASANQQAGKGVPAQGPRVRPEGNR